MPGSKIHVRRQRNRRSASGEVLAALQRSAVLLRVFSSATLERTTLYSSSEGSSRALSMREAIGMSDTYTLSGQNVYVSGPRRIRFVCETYTSHLWRYTSCSKSLVDGVLLYEKAPTHSTYVEAIYSRGNALAVIGVEKVASALGLESLEACLP